VEALRRRINVRSGVAVLFFLLVGAARPWTEAIPVDVAGSRVELLSVTSNIASDFDYANNRQGPIYFNDCLAWVDRADVAVTHVQFIYTIVNTSGEVKYPPLPLDIHYKAWPGEKRDDRDNCRDHGYANGADGRWLVAWANIVDFADGTSWHAPPLDQMTPYILAALRRTL
jgi:hypothetical protein